MTKYVGPVCDSVMKACENCIAILIFCTFIVMAILFKVIITMCKRLNVPLNQ